MMRERVIFRCRTQTGFRLGQAESGDLSQVLHADTLFSALVNVFAGAWPEQVGELIEDFKTDKLRISTAFPMLEGKRLSQTAGSGGKQEPAPAGITPDAPARQFFFLPKPEGLKPEHFGNTQLNHKAWKKAQFISEAAFMSLGVSGKDRKFGSAAKLVLGNQCLMLVDELLESGVDWNEARLFKTQLRPQVRVHSPESTDGFWFSKNLRLTGFRDAEMDRFWQPHFWCYLDTAADGRVSDSRIRAALRLLADTGVGGDRSCGLGQFEGLEFQVLSEGQGQNSLPSGVEGAGSWLLLSPAWPTDQEEFRAFRAWRLIMRGGSPLNPAQLAKQSKGFSQAQSRTLTPDHYRKSVRMIQEGAVLNKPVTGGIANLNPVKNGKAILRYGKCFSLPFPQSEHSKTSFQ